MRGFLRSKPKIDPRELALAESLTVARFAGLFGDALPEEMELVDESTPEAQAGPVELGEPQPNMAGTGEPRVDVVQPVARRRPPIVVIGAAPPAIVEPGHLVGVMASPGDDVGPDTWSLPATRPTLVPMRRSGPARHRSIERPDGKRSPRRSGPPAAPPAHCPYCATPLDPPPQSSRRCDQCRQPIVARQVDGRTVYLSKAALPIFESERRRVAISARLIRERDRWLELAVAAGGSSQRQAQLSTARLTEATVVAARAFYLGVVDRSVRAARREGEWDLAARLRRDEATVVDRAEGAPRPPSAEVLALFRDGVAAELRGIAGLSRDAELVPAPCCDVCQSDDGLVIRITAELRQPRLPHAGCPKGLCRCHWDLAERDRALMRRYLRRRATAEPRASAELRATVPGELHRVG